MTPEQLAAQLRRPHGAAAADVGQGMNAHNAGVNRRAIALLGVADGHHVLEIGPGNGAFAQEVVTAAASVTYTGVDWSADMVAEAGRRHHALVGSGRARFVQGSSDQLPFPEAHFDRVLTVNTLYFWEQPQDHLAEVARVLKPGGVLSLGFGDRAFMQNLPFVQHGFTLYDAADVHALLERTGFQVLEAQRYEETGRSNTGEAVHKVFHLLRCRTDA